MAVPVIFPVAAESMITVAWFKRLIAREGLYDCSQIRIASCPVFALDLTLVIPFELAGDLSDRPHRHADLRLCSRL